MLERLLLPTKHAIAILIHDHDKVKKLFDQFEKSDSSAEKEKIIGEAITELKIHAVVEEEIFYPAVRKKLEQDMMNEADEEHHVARVLIAELDEQGGGGDHRHAKFTVLSESVRHHIKEEENEMMPKAKALDVDFEALGAEILKRKKELKRDGIPNDAEHGMVAAVQGRDDTPAVAARRTSPRTASVKRRDAGPKSGGAKKKSSRANGSRTKARSKRSR